jgi:hypothetical protein
LSSINDFALKSIFPANTADLAMEAEPEGGNKAWTGENQSSLLPLERIDEDSYDVCQENVDDNDAQDGRCPDQFAGRVGGEISLAGAVGSSLIAGLEPLSLEGQGWPEPCPEGGASEEADGLGVDEVGSKNSEALSVKVMENLEGWGTSDTTTEVQTVTGVGHYTRESDDRRELDDGLEIEQIGQEHHHNLAYADELELRLQGEGNKRQDWSGPVGGTERCCGTEAAEAGQISLRRASIMSCVEDGGVLTSRKFYDSFLSSSSVFFTR